MSTLKHFISAEPSLLSSEEEEDPSNPPASLDRPSNASSELDGSNARITSSNATGGRSNERGKDLSGDNTEDFTKAIGDEFHFDEERAFQLAKTFEACIANRAHKSPFVTKWMQAMRIEGKHALLDPSYCSPFSSLLGPTFSPYRGRAATHGEGGA